MSAAARGQGSPSLNARPFGEQFGNYGHFFSPFTPRQLRGPSRGLIAHSTRTHRFPKLSRRAEKEKNIAREKNDNVPNNVGLREEEKSNVTPIFCLARSSEQQDPLCALARLAAMQNPLRPAVKNPFQLETCKVCGQISSSTSKQLPQQRRAFVFLAEDYFSEAREKSAGNATVTQRNNLSRLCDSQGFGQEFIEHVGFLMESRSIFGQNKC